MPASPSFSTVAQYGMAGMDGRGEDVVAPLPDINLLKLTFCWMEDPWQKRPTNGRSRLQTLSKAIPDGKNGSTELVKSQLEARLRRDDRIPNLLLFVRTVLKLT